MLSSQPEIESQLIVPDASSLSHSNKSKPRKKSAINGWLKSGQSPASALPYIAPPDIYTKTQKDTNDTSNKHRRKRVPPPSMNSNKKSNTNDIKNTMNEFIEMGFNRNEILQSFNDVNLRLLWSVDSLCLIYSRRKEQWFKGTVIGIYINTNTKEKWLTIKYNNSNTKRMQRFNKNIKPIELKYKSNKALIQIICSKLKSKQLTVDKLQLAQQQNECSLTDATQCNAVNRLIVSLTSYLSLNSKCEYIYATLIDDYIHFKDHHQHQSLQINKFIKYNNKQNTMQQKQQNTVQLDASVDLYKDIMDSLHFRLIHCFEDESIAEKGNTYIDAEFERINNKIQEKIATKTKRKNGDCNSK